MLFFIVCQKEVALSQVKGGTEYVVRVCGLALDYGRSNHFITADKITCAMRLSDHYLAFP